VIKKSVGKITQTPTFLLWLVLMSPPLIWTGWYLINPDQNSMPTSLVIIPLVLSPLLYIWLIEIGKLKTTNNSARESNSLDTKKEEISPSVSNGNEENNRPTPVKKLRPINSEEEKALRDCFPWGVYYLQKVDYLPQAILCLGKLMTAPEKAYPTIKANLERVFHDRFLIIFQETLQGQPFFALVPNPYSKTGKQKQPVEQLTRPGMALGLLLLTLVTTTMVGAEISGVTAEQLEANPLLITEGLAYSLCLIAILGVHELGHYLLAVYYKIRTTLPYFIPIPFFLGTFGAFISIKAAMPNRKAVFDVGLAGPLAGFLVTLPVLAWG
jgi:membrane-associated protease RseP (regulator of RpoE activity)